ncbi:hypothetical protein evm_015342, partial [Chilo suppressalis]
VEATAPQVLPAYTSIILEVTMRKEDPPTAIEFEETHYVGNFTTTEGLIFDRIITLAEGYDESVEFDLEGENAQWFALDRVENGARLVLQSPIPPAVLANNHQLLFIVRAERQSAVARAIIVILLTDDVSAGQVLGFERNYYVGSLNGTTVHLSQIVLNEGFSSDVRFSLVGELAPFFILQDNLATLTISLANAIPEDSIPANGIIIIQVEATAPQVLPAYTSIILEVTMRKEDPPTAIEFEETHYVGNFTTTEGLIFDRIITLAEGYDESVEFDLEGENAQWFALDRVENGARLVLQSPIPPAVLANNHQLLFIVRAERQSAIARATIVILLTDDVSAGQVLGFERNYYVGSLNGTTVHLSQIVLNEGFSSDVRFSLVGELAPFFILQDNLATLTISLANAIPEDSIPANGIIIIQVEATAPQVLPAYTSIILEVTMRKEDPPTAIEFEETHYVGNFTTTEGLIFDRIITLAEGYDESVEFDLEGENAQWFALDRVENGARLVLQSPIPPAVLANNHQLLFIVRAERQSAIARATIVILLTDDVSAGQVLGFERNYYVGSLNGTTVHLSQIVLNEGFSSDVRFSLVGELAPFFILQDNLATLTISLANAIPEDSIPANGIIIIQVEATAPQVLPAYTSIILEVTMRKEDPPTAIEFEETHYVGNFTTTEGLIFDRIITLAEGYDESVEFDLEGENAQWFALDRVENGARLVLQSPIPPAVLANNHQLLFIVRAERQSAIARATIVILLTDDVSAGQVLGFERNYYVGSLNGTTVHLSQIVLNEGFSSDVRFSLVGELAPFFILQDNLATLTISLANAIPEDSIPANGIIIIQVEATAPQVLPAYTSIILEVTMRKEDPPTAIEFEETHYVGNFTTTEGLIFDRIITLAEGYDESVEFDLEGENAQWFALDRVENGARLVLQSPIPPAVLANNHQLLFIVRAERQSAIARATIVILLTDDVSAGQVLGFERNYYVGSLNGTTVHLSQIVLNEGFSSDVRFSLVGELAPFFILQDNLATLTISLANAIPEDSIPANGIIIIQVEATAPQVLPAYTSIILEVTMRKEDPPTAIEFEETHYVGNFTTTEGLIFDRIITLAEGYDESVEFDLEGENAQWFALDRVENGARLVLQSPIPPAVLANNHQLLFIVRAERQSAIARATIVILLTDDVSAGQVLGFERNYYVGSLNGTTVHLSQIVLNEGFSSDVRFSLVGELAPFFILQDNLATLTISLANAIPEDSIPANGIIIIQVEATAPQVLPAYTSIILEVTMRVLANNHQLLFIVRAKRQSAIARATIVILLTDGNWITTLH